MELWKVLGIVRGWTFSPPKPGEVEAVARWWRGNLPELGGNPEAVQSLKNFFGGLFPAIEGAKASDWKVDEFRLSLLRMRRAVDHLVSEGGAAIVTAGPAYAPTSPETKIGADTAKPLPPIGDRNAVDLKIQELFRGRSTLKIKPTKRAMIRALEDRFGMTTSEKTMGETNWWARVVETKADSKGRLRDDAKTHLADGPDDPGE